MKTTPEATKQVKKEYDGLGLEALFHAAERQNEGAWFDILHPVSFEKTGMRIKVAGPDSEVQRKARLKLQNYLNTLKSSAVSGRERAAIEFLADCILDWEIVENGQSLPFSHANACRILSAGTWVRAQIDAFAGDRSPYFEAH